MWALTTSQKRCHYQLLNNLQAIRPLGPWVVEDFAKAKTSLEDFKYRFIKHHGEGQQIYTLPIDGKPSTHRTYHDAYRWAPYRDNTGYMCGALLTVLR
jgi:hypothetical protein